ncbi:MAG: hypothetical protein SGJ15_04320 [Bacteroidota bacterium]|nr:hypothetical protein [Bacteroidota bacterium]
MKKTILMAGAFLFAMSITSCKKNYTCKCSKTYTSGTGVSTKDNAVYTYKENRATADNRCAENETTASDLGGNYTINCDIVD